MNSTIDFFTTSKNKLRFDWLFPARQFPAPTSPRSTSCDKKFQSTGKGPPGGTRLHHITPSVTIPYNLVVTQNGSIPIPCSVAFAARSRNGNRCKVSSPHADDDDAEPPEGENQPWPQLVRLRREIWCQLSMVALVGCSQHGHRSTTAASSSAL